VNLLYDYFKNNNKFLHKLSQNGFQFQDNTCTDSEFTKSKLYLFRLLLLTLIRIKMKTNKYYLNFLWIGFTLFAILFLVTCQKNLTESNSDNNTPFINAKTDLQSRIKAFSDRMKAKKAGLNVINSRDGSYEPEEANDLVEGTMNYNYCDLTIPHWEITVDDTTIVAPLTDGKIEEVDVEDLYNNIVAFSSRRFCAIEDESKTPRGYDLEILGISGNNITFKLTSIVGNGTIYSPFSRKTFDAGYYEADPNNLHCNNGGWRNAPVEMMQFINYNIVYAISPGYMIQIQGNIGRTDENYHAFAWRFRCDGTGTGHGGCCSCNNACSGYNLDNIYCLNSTSMNSYLDEFEYNFTHEGFWAPANTMFLAMTSMEINHDCGSSSTGDIKDRWLFYWNYGIVMSDTRELLNFECE
jgi:hypothetical protein